MNKSADPSAVLERLTGIFGELFQDGPLPASLSAETRLIEDLGMNSISLLYMALAIENEFDCHFSNDDFPTLHTIGNVVECICTHITK